MEDKKIVQYFIVFAIIMAILLLSSKEKMETRTISVDWQKEYILTTSSKLNDYSSFTSNTPYYDYDNLIISDVASSISTHSLSAKEAIDNTAKYVYDNIEYYSESDSGCFDRTAPEILKSGKGQCDTESIAISSILRKMGIATRVAGGCVIRNDKCILQSLFPVMSIQNINLETRPEVDLTATTFSRAGGLHAWLQAYDGEKWVNIESTKGMIADTECYDYHVELFPANEDKKSICVSTNKDYALACRNDDYTGLNNNGLGLVSEVN